MNNQPCMISSTVIGLNIAELHYHPLAIRMKRRDGSYHTVWNIFGRICASTKMGDVNLQVFNMIEAINE